VPHNSLHSPLHGAPNSAINSGATLNGTGTVSAISVNSGGTLMPGLPATVGTLKATSVTFASGASYLITINGATNSKVTATGLGFLLNNEMDDFAPKPGEANSYGLVQGEANAIAPGKAPLSSMTPIGSTKLPSRLDILRP